MTRNSFLIRSLAILIASTVLILPGPVNAFPEVFDLKDNRAFILEGTNILHLDYLVIRDNLVTEDRQSYPLGKVWLIIYDPDPYTDMDTMSENKWRSSRELERYELPGPGSQGRWADGDEVIFRNAGVYFWDSNDYDRVVFRFMIENPSPDYDSDTIMWGTIVKDESYIALELSTDRADVKFRTLDLPELFPPPYVIFEEIWFEHDVTMYDEETDEEIEGLELHIKFELDSMRGEIARLAAYIHTDKDGESVECRIDDPEYMTGDGFLTSQTDFMPYYLDTIYHDFTLFFPYDAFPSSDDYVAYYINIEILDEDWDLINSYQSPVFEVFVPE